jgi:hypothetical protein
LRLFRFESAELSAHAGSGGEFIAVIANLRPQHLQQVDFVGERVQIQIATIVGTAQARGGAGQAATAELGVVQRGHGAGFPDEQTTRSGKNENTRKLGLRFTA